MIPRRNILRIYRKFFSQPGYGFLAFRKRFKSYLTYLFFNGYSAPPETISLFLTYRCNLRCPMCGQWGDGGSYKQLNSDELRSELSLEEIKSFLDDVGPWKPNITLFGGEPMLYANWIEVLKYVKRNGMRCNIVTNGILLGKRAGEVVKAGMDEIIFSLDGDEEVHDKMRGLKGAFKKGVEGFLTLNEMREKYSSHIPRINISCTIYEYNYRNLIDLVPVAERICADSITFHHLLFLGVEQYSRHNEYFKKRFGNPCPDWAGFVHRELPEINPERLIEEFNKLRSLDTEVDIHFYPNFTEEEIKRYYSQFEFTPTSYRNRCASLWMVSYIFPDGSVRPYHSMNFTAGNIREKKFSEIWNGKEYRDYRCEIKRLKTFDVCTKGCTELYRY